MSTQTEPSIAESPATPAVWHVGERPNSRAAYPVLTDTGGHVGFSFKRRTAVLFAASAEYHAAAAQLLLEHAALQSEGGLHEPCDCDACTALRPIVEKVERTAS